MKPALQVLCKHQIPNRWGFPFSLYFTHGGKRYQCSTLVDFNSIPSQLCLLDPTCRFTSPLSTTPSERQQDAASPSNAWCKQEPTTHCLCMVAPTHLLIPQDECPYAEILRLMGRVSFLCTQSLASRPELTNLFRFTLKVACFCSAVTCCSYAYIAMLRFYCLAS